MACRSKYNKLSHYLMRAEKSAFSLSFSEIEKILGFELPQSAYKYPAHWANSPNYPTQIAKAWLDAGYRTEQVNLSNRTVVFRKGEISTNIPKVKRQKVCKNISLMTADVAVKLIKDYFNETIKDPHGRYMSWCHCYKAFSKNRKVYDEQVVDYLSLHLAVYLASWGMLRNSFLFQKDYKVHIPVVRVIQEEKYNPLRGISAKELCNPENLNLLDDAAQRIRDCYAAEQPSLTGGSNNATDTLVTKILLGTLGCAPAFDRYYKDSVKKNHISSGIFNQKSVRSVAEFYCMHFNEFETLRQEISQRGIEYPPMKLMDMCFWQDAYVDDLRKRKRSLTNGLRGGN